jgi:hypothetical protein
MSMSAAALAHSATTTWWAGAAERLGRGLTEGRPAVGRPVLTLKVVYVNVIKDGPGWVSDESAVSQPALRIARTPRKDGNGQD